MPKNPSKFIKDLPKENPSVRTGFIDPKMNQDKER
jgi:hypothetical protein